MSKNATLMMTSQEFSEETLITFASPLLTTSSQSPVNSISMPICIEQQESQPSSLNSINDYNNFTTSLSNCDASVQIIPSSPPNSSPESSSLICSEEDELDSSKSLHSNVGSVSLITPNQCVEVVDVSETLPSISGSVSRIRANSRVPVAVSMFQESLKRKKQNQPSKISEHAKIQRMVVPAWDDFAKRKKEKEDEDSKSILKKISDVAASLSSVPTQFQEYIQLKKEMSAYQIKCTKEQHINKKNVPDTGNNDGFFNIFKREYLNLSLADQKELFPLILDILEEFLE